MKETSSYEIAGFITYTTEVKKEPLLEDKHTFKDEIVNISKDNESNKILDFSLTYKGKTYNLDSQVRHYNSLLTPIIEEFIERELKVIFINDLVEKFGVEGFYLFEISIKATKIKSIL